MKVRLLSTKNGLKSASLKRLAVALTESLGYKVWRSINSKPKRWNLMYGDAVDKLTQYKYFQQQGLSALEFTTSQPEAEGWLNNGKTVFARTLLNASCGHGIIVLTPETDGMLGVPKVPVYTLYKPKKREFRVHIFKDDVVTIVEKKRKKDWQGDKSDAKIRNLEHGYVFCQEFEINDALQSRIQTIALQAAKVSKSDFRGVDIGYNEKKDDVFVIEVNSAPGIEGSNVDKYVQSILKHL